jgi:hypothetical protein
LHTALCVFMECVIPRYRWEVNIKMYFHKTVSDAVYWIELADDSFSVGLLLLLLLIDTSWFSDYLKLSIMSMRYFI